MTPGRHRASGRVLAALAVAGAAALPSLAAPKPPTPRTLVDASAGEATLARLAHEYREGDRDATLGEIGLWTAERIRREVEDLLRPAPRGSRSSDPALVCAATLLHVHRALLDSSSAPEHGRHHLGAAARLLLAAADVPECAEVARRLFLLVGLELQAYLDVAAAHEVARAGLRRFEDDPELLTVLGTTLEARPGMRAYDPPPDAKPGSPELAVRPGFTVEGGGAPGEWRPFPAGGLGAAEASFRRALDGDPGLGEARLRLGRVRLLRGRTQEAIAELRHVAGGDGSLRRRYLARLFEGRAHEKRGDLEPAAEAYRAAVAVEPEGQSAWIGLGRALDLLGRREEAQEAFAAALGPEKKRGDPWWTYEEGDVDRLAPLLAELQAALSR